MFVFVTSLCITLPAAKKKRKHIDENNNTFLRSASPIYWEYESCHCSLSAAPTGSGAVRRLAGDRDVGADASGSAVLV